MKQATKICMFAVYLCTTLGYGAESYYIKDGKTYTSDSSPANRLNVPNDSETMGFYCKNTTGKHQLWTKEIITVSPQCFETLVDDRDFKSKKIGDNIVKITYASSMHYGEKVDGYWELKYYKDDKIKTLIGFQGCERQWDRIRSKHEMYVSTTKNGKYTKLCEAFFSYQIQRKLCDRNVKK